MPEVILRKMRASGVREPYALLNAAGYKEGDSEESTKAKLSRYMKRKKKGRKSASAFKRKAGMLALLALLAGGAEAQLRNPTPLPWVPPWVAKPRVVIQTKPQVPIVYRVLQWLGVQVNR